MKAAPRKGHLLDAIALGEHIIAHPEICHGKPTYRGTRIMVRDILEQLALGESVAQIVKAWGGRVSHEAVIETIRLAQSALLDSRGKLNRAFAAQLAA